MKISLIKVTTTLTALLLSFNLFAAEDAKSTLPKIEEGKQYLKIIAPLSSDKEVIEFFSFNCPSCYRVDSEFGLSKVIKSNLPKGIKFKRYTLNDYGRLAPELAEAWAIANVLGVADEFADDMYDAVQSSKTVKTAEDIKGVFENIGVDADKYEKMKSNFLVKTFMVQQTEAAKQFRPKTIPSFYVNGKYVINPSGLDQSSNEAAINDYSRVINHLSALK